MNLSFTDLQLIKKVDTFDLNKKNVFYFPNVDGVASHFIESLIFRLENVESQSIIILGDKKKVRPTDVKRGLFIESDYNKTRSDVLTARYTGLCKTLIYSTGRMATTLDSLFKQDINLFYISTSENLTQQNYTKMLNELKTKAIGMSHTNSNAYVFSLGSIEQNITLKMNIVTATKILGNTTLQPDIKKASSVQSQFIQSTMSAQLLFNTVNSLLTESMSINYSGMEFNYLEGNTNVEYILGLPESSIFNILYNEQFINSQDIKGLLAISKSFDRFLTQNEADVERELVGSSNDITIASFNLRTLSHNMYKLLERLDSAMISHANAISLEGNSYNGDNIINNILSLGLDNTESIIKYSRILIPRDYRITNDISNRLKYTNNLPFEEKLILTEKWFIFINDLLNPNYSLPTQSVIELEVSEVEVG